MRLDPNTADGHSVPARAAASLLDRHGVAVVAWREGAVVWANETARSLVHPLVGAGAADIEDAADGVARVEAAMRFTDEVGDLTSGERTDVGLEFAANHALISRRAAVDVFDDADGPVALISFPARDSGSEAEAHIARLNAMLEATVDIITVIDKEGRVRYSNGAAGRVTGFDGTDVNGLSMLEFIHPEDAGVAADAFARGVLGGEQIEPVEVRLRFADDQWHDVEAEITSPITIDGGECHVVTIRDVTERMRRQREAAESHRRLESLVENIDDVIVLLGPDLSVIYASPSIERLIDAPAYTNVGENAFNDMHPDDVANVIEAIEDVTRAPGRRARAELRLRHQRFGWRWVEASVVNRLDDPAVGGLVCTLRDITAQRDADAELRRLRDQDREEMSRLREADQLKDDFLTTVSHELRTPLTSVRGFSALLRSQRDTMDDATRETLIERISVNAQEMEDMVEQLLDFSRLQAGRARVEMQTLSVDDQISDLLGRLEHHLEHHVVVVEVGEAKVRADPRAFDHVVRNLLTNAARYSEPGTRIEIRSAPRGTDIDIHVTDHGIGIPAEDHGRIFRSFFQAAPGATGRRGVGVGLNIARRYAQLQSGHLTLESVPGEGSTFTFTLPAAV